MYMIKMIYAKCTWIIALKVNWSTCSQICPGDQLDLDDLSRKPPSAALAVNLKGGRGGCKSEIQIRSNTSIFHTWTKTPQDVTLQAISWVISKILSKTTCADITLQIDNYIFTFYLNLLHKTNSCAVYLVCIWYKYIYISTLHTFEHKNVHIIYI